MFKQWIDRFASVNNNDEKGALQKADLERVSAALLVEIARADHQLDDSEVQSIATALKKSSSLAHEEIDTILSDAIVDADSAVSLHEHVRLVNEHFSRQQKVLLMEQMWRVAVADGNIDQYEDYTIRKLSDLIYIRHSEFIQTKLRVLES